MNSFTFPSFAVRTSVAIAVGLACLGAQAQSEPVEASVSVGLGHVDGSGSDKSLFGQYSGLRQVTTLGILGIDYSLRDPQAGKWVDFLGTNLLGDTRELEFVWKNPGTWKFAANYNELTRYEPLIVNTGLLGVGTTAPVVNSLAVAGSGTDLDLKTRRTGLGLGFTRDISSQLQLYVNVKVEEKDGSRLFGALVNNRGCVSSNAVPCLGDFPALLLPEPIKSYHSQLEARASYSLDKFRVHATYYGSVFSNSNSTMSPVSGTSTGIASNYQIALPPDNQAHQFDLSGSYDISQATRTTFKLAWATALQNADFPSGLTGPLHVVPNGSVAVSSPGARVDTTLAKLGFSSRWSQQLSLLGDLRIENKDDQTNLFNYNPIGTNHNLPNRKLQAKLQANWQFNSAHRGTLGADYESIDRGTYTASSVLAGISALRQKTQETGLRAELRSRLNDELGGTVSVSSSQRDGSNWFESNGNNLAGVNAVANPAVTFAPGSGAVLMPTLADRQRNKLRLSADWQPNKDFNLQLSAEENLDSYNSPSGLGMHDARVRQLGLDWSYTLSRVWALNGYVSQATQTMSQSLSLANAPVLENTNLSVSFGVTGKPSSKVQLGANLSYLDDKTLYSQSAATGLPDTSYRETALKLFATYQVDKRATVRLDLVHQNISSDDWTWRAFTYSDGTTVRAEPNQSVNLIGVTYVYQWQ